MKNKSKYLLPAVSFLLFLTLIVLIKTVDVHTNPLSGAGEIGLYGLNSAVKSIIGEVNMTWYKVTEILGFISIAAGLAFAVVGLCQLVKRKSLLKVDREILALGGLYVTLGVIYVFFEKVIINYRPVIMPGDTEAEASFPSSHTVLALVILGGIFMLLSKYVKAKPLLYALKALCAALAVITCLGRLLSGVHWFTDILGGVILSVCLLSMFCAFIRE